MLENLTQCTDSVLLNSKPYIDLFNALNKQQLNIEIRGKGQVVKFGLKTSRIRLKKSQIRLADGFSF